VGARLGGELPFPPLGDVRPDSEARYERHPAFPPAHVLVPDALAVVSKLGGGTLLDSLAATAVVLPAASGDHEAKNGALWKQLGSASTSSTGGGRGSTNAFPNIPRRNLVEACGGRRPKRRDRGRGGVSKLELRPRMQGPA
jgi:hypothetical protein